MKVEPLDKTILLISAKSPKVTKVGTTRYAKALAGLAESTNLSVEHISDLGYVDIVELKGDEDKFRRFFDRLVGLIEAARKEG